MKRFFFFMMVVLLAGACKKEGSATRKNVQGSWELRNVNGGFSGSKSYEPGNGNIIAFAGEQYTQHYSTPDTSYSVSGKFDIYKDNPCQDYEELTLITLGDQGYSYMLTIKNDTLILGALPCWVDGSDYIYVRTQ